MGDLFPEEKTSNLANQRKAYIRFSHTRNQSLRPAAQFTLLLRFASHKGLQTLSILSRVFQNSENARMTTVVVGVQWGDEGKLPNYQYGLKSIILIVWMHILSGCQTEDFC